MIDGLIDYVGVWCPYCGERFETGVDASAGSQSYYEDCQVCCAPIRMQIDIDAQGQVVNLRTFRDDE
ncbi:MAG: CPXCG motif-containing cysteine-rich protein [Chromatiales bacterium]|jgi:hypothetical protein